MKRCPERRNGTGAKTAARTTARRAAPFETSPSDPRRAMGRTIRKSKGPIEPEGGPSFLPAKPKPWPMPKEMRRAPSNPTSPESSPSKPRPPRRSSARGTGRAKKQLVEEPEGPDGTLTAANGNERIDAESAITTDDAHSGYEEIGGRARSGDGAWIAWSLTRPVFPKSIRAKARPKLPVTAIVDGLSNHGFQWEGMKKHLINPHACLLRWEYRGHGVSDDPVDLKSVTIQGVADDLERVLLDVSLRGLADTSKIILVGYSMGCQVALEWCRAHAQYVRGIALILGTTRRSMDSVAVFPFAADGLATLMRFFPRSFSVFWRCVFTVAHVFSRVGHFYARLFGFIRVTRAEFAPFYAHMRRLDCDAYVRMLVSGQAHDATDVLRLLDRREVPTLIVSGGKDVTAARGVSRMMQKAAPRAQCVHIPKACHAGLIGEREAIAESLTDFFVLAKETAEFNEKRLMEVTGMQSSPGSPAKSR